MVYNRAVEEFRDDEYPMMKGKELRLLECVDAKNFTGKVYLDHGGTTIYARSLIEAFSEKMLANLYGNPHSASDPASLSGHIVDSIREKALHFFNADPEHFDLVFVANATAAIKLVAESFRDLAAASTVSGTFWYGYHKDAHNSIVGVREYADGYEGHIDTSNDGSLPGLFAYPGQSNMTGRRLPLLWTGKLRESTETHHQNTYSLLDAAALATSAPLDLSDPDTAPGFTALSFYKIFGFPDLGALIIREKSGHILSWRRYFGGGNVNSVTVFHEATYQRRDEALHEGLEDGTLPSHSIVVLGCAMDVHKKLYGSMKAISRHTSFLGHRFYTRLSSLRHYNGRAVCVIYIDIDDPDPYTDPSKQGGTIAFNIVRADGSYVKYTLVEKSANDKRIYLRSGGLCNPGGLASHIQLEPWQFKRAWSSGHKCADAVKGLIGGKPMGVVRASLGAMITVRDVDICIAFLSDTFIENRDEVLTPVPRLELQPCILSRNGALSSRNGSFDINTKGRAAPRSPQQPRRPTQNRVRLQNETQHSGDAGYNFHAENIVAPRSYQQIRYKTSTLSLKKAPELRPKRSFFGHKSFDSNRDPPPEVSPATSEISGSTLTAEDAELRDLLKRNLVLGSNKSRGRLRFWKVNRTKV